MPEQEDPGLSNEAESAAATLQRTGDADRDITDTTDRSPLICANCDAQLTGAFCSSCGQAATRSRRLDFRRLIGEFVEKVFNLESSLLRTVVNLTLRPGTVCRDYVNGKRTLYTNPVTYLLLYVVLSTVANSLIRSVTGYKADPLDIIFEEDWGVLFNLTLFVPMALSVALAFRRAAHTVAETYVVVLYTLTHASLLTVPIWATLAPFMDYDFVATSGSDSSFYMKWGIYALPGMFGFWCLYLIWAAKDFYGVSWATASVKILGAVARCFVPFFVGIVFGTGIVMAVSQSVDSSFGAEPSGWFFILLALAVVFVATVYLAAMYRWPRVMKWIHRIVTGPAGILLLLLCAVFAFAPEEMIIESEVVSNAEQAARMALVFGMMCFLSVVSFFCTGETEGAAVENGTAANSDVGHDNTHPVGPKNSADR